MWSYVMDNLTIFKNDFYDNDSTDPIWPSLSPKQMKVWNRYFNRWDPSCHPKASNRDTFDCESGNIPCEGQKQEDWSDSWLCHDKLSMNR